MKKYNSYKDSGIEWIGEIPEGWTIKKMKYVADTHGRIGFRGYTTEDLVSEGEGAYVIGGKHITNNVLDLSKPDYISWDKYYESPEIMVNKGDLITAQRGTLGRTVIVREDIGKATINPSLILINNIRINAVYLYWYMVSSSFLSKIDLMNTSTAVPMISQNQLDNVEMPMPSVSEQQSIATYLDHKVGQIDASISAIADQIADLKAYRQSVISKAVTKGLNPDAKMKDSGIEWIGEIPEGWECLKLSLLTDKIGSGKTPTGGAEVYSDAGVMFIRSQNVYNDGLRKNDTVFISETIHQTMQNSKVCYGDVLLNITGGSIGRSCLINDIAINANVNQHVCIVRSKNDVLYSAFLHYYLISSNTQNQIKACQTGSNREELNFDQIGKFYINLPPMAEQQAIASYLDQKTAEIDSAIKALEDQAADLKALKQSVISEAVTGKIDVRDWIPNC